MPKVRNERGKHEYRMYERYKSDFLEDTTLIRRN